MADQLTCPFCREAFTAAPGDVCPDCEVVLEPPRTDKAALAPSELDDPQDLTLPWYSLGAGRGAVLALCLLGLVLFFTPWLTLRTPDVYQLSGQALAADRGFWFGGGAVSWAVLIPLLLSRRSLRQLQGVRVIAALLASVTWWQVLLLSALAPATSSQLLGHQFAYGFYASAVTSLLATWAASRLGTSSGATYTRLRRSSPEHSRLH